MYYDICFFFFQAEDGIRDLTVTGVQTCALPIFAITGVGSELDKHAEKNGWLARFPMWDWVGGRTSVMSAVGLVPMALEGFDIDKFLAGAAAMGERTRTTDFLQEAGHLLAVMWVFASQRRRG